VALRVKRQQRPGELAVRAQFRVAGHVPDLAFETGAPRGIRQYGGMVDFDDEVAASGKRMDGALAAASDHSGNLLGDSPVVHDRGDGVIGVHGCVGGWSFLRMRKQCGGSGAKARNRPAECREAEHAA